MWKSDFDYVENIGALEILKKKNDINESNLCMQIC